MKKEEAIKLVTNKKVYVNGKSVEIQQKLFELGFLWNDNKKNGKRIDHEEEPFLYTTNSHEIAWGCDMKNFVNNTNYKEITVEEILNITIDEEFKDGDFLYVKYARLETIFIFRETNCYNWDKTSCYFYHSITDDANRVIEEDLDIICCHNDDIEVLRKATKDEVKILYEELRKEGLGWDWFNKCIWKIKPLEYVLLAFRCSDKWHLGQISDISDGGLWLVNRMNSLPANAAIIPYKGNEYRLSKSHKEHNDI